MLPPIMPEFKPIPTMFQSVGDLLMFIGMLVCGGFIILYALKEVVKEIWQYVSSRKNDV